MSKSVKMIVGIAASIAIPFAAPALAAAILASGASALATGLTSAAIGAGLGAATSAVTGTNIGKGALFGGLGGGLGSLAKGLQAANIAKAGAGTALQAGASGAGTAVPAAGMGIAPLAGEAAVGTGTVLAPQAAGISSGYGGVAGLSGLGTPAGMPEGTNTVLQGYQAPAPAANLASPAPSTTFDTGNYLATINATPGLSSSTLPPSFGQRFMNTIKAPFTAENLGNTALNTGKYLTGSALAGSGMDPQQEALMRQQRHQMRLADQMNQQNYATRTEQGLKLIREADYYDPEYMGLQRARQAQLAGARDKQRGLRGLNTAQAQAEGRRYDLGTSRATGTAYDQGYQSGIGARTQTRAAGVGLLPGPYTTNANDYGSMQSAYNYADQRRRLDQQDVGALFGNLSGNNKKYQTDDPVRT